MALLIATALTVFALGIVLGITAHLWVVILVRVELINLFKRG